MKKENEKRKKIGDKEMKKKEILEREREINFKVLEKPHFSSLNKINIPSISPTYTNPSQNNMNNPIIFSLLFLCSYCFITTTQLETSSNPINFIQKSCNTTLYPSLCYKCLFNYSNSIKPPNQAQQLAQISLQVTISRARSVSRFITKVSNISIGSKSRENQALKDCLDLIGGSVDELSQSLKELNGLTQSSVVNNPNNPDFSWHMSNCRTWVSAALTNDITCIDGFSEQSSNVERNVKDTIKAKVRIVAQVTSISLAFITHFAEGSQ